MTTFHLAQLNVARLAHPPGDERVQDFFDALDAINAVAEASPGFVWRYQEEGDAPPATADPNLVVNLSVWQTPEALFDYVYRSEHGGVLRRRREWFVPLGSSHQVMWWIPAGHVPTVDEGLARLWHLDRFGPTARAFTLKRQFPSPDGAGEPVDHKPDPWCAGWT